MTTVKTAHRLHVMICDDHEVSRAGLQAVVHSAPDLIVVGQAASFARAVELSLEVTPHVALVSQTLDRDAVRVVKTLSRGGVGVIVLGPPRAQLGVVEALRAGARSYLTDAVAPAQLITAIRAAARGETTLDPQAVAPLLLPVSGPVPSGAEIGAAAAAHQTRRLLRDRLTTQLFGRLSSAQPLRLLLRAASATTHYVKALLRCRRSEISSATFASGDRKHKEDNTGGR